MDNTKQESFPITYISRGDIAGLGYDTYTISDSEMEAIADDLANDYLHQLYWSSLKITIEDQYSHIPKKGRRKVFLQEYQPTSSNEKSAALAVQVALYDVSEIVSTDKTGTDWEESKEDLKKWLSLQVPIEVVSACDADTALADAQSVCTANQWVVVAPVENTQTN